jgi:cyclic-di-GMP phosphodiesterase TipF (flagellum assembly factor)
MKLLTFAVTACVYALMGIAAAALLWRTGGGWGAGAAAAIGTVGLFLALHALVAGRMAQASIRHDVSRIRDANLIFAEELEKTQDDLAKLSTLVHEETAKRSEVLSSEVRMLEDLVRRMTDGMQARLGKPRLPDEPQARRAPREPTQQELLLQTVRDALADNRVDLYLQPILSLPQRRTVFYESYSRLRDASGRVMLPAEYLPLAEPEGLVSAIDNLLLFRCVQIVRKLAKQERKVGIFCNISLRSLSDETFFPQFLDFLAENRDLAGALIFELGQAAFVARGAAESRNMAKLADLGYRFSLDKVTNLQVDLVDLARADVKFLKVAAPVLAEQLAEVNGRLAIKALKDIDAADFAAMTRRHGVEVIAEKIEQERQVLGVLELDIRYGQGHLFGEPRAIRDQVMSETAPPTDFMKGPGGRASAA